MSIVCSGFIMLSLPLYAKVRPLDLSDEPLMAQIKPAPTNIMFVLDDSGSMTYDILVIGQTNGGYPSPDDTSDNKGKGFCYVFDYQKGDVAFKDNWRYTLSSNLAPPSILSTLPTRLEDHSCSYLVSTARRIA